MSFPERLKEARISLGYKQKQVAEAMGIETSTYCGYETGKRQPDVAKIKQLASILEVSGDYLLETGFPDGTEEMSSERLPAGSQDDKSRGGQAVRLAAEQPEGRRAGDLQSGCQAVGEHMVRDTPADEGRIGYQTNWGSSDPDSMDLFKDYHGLNKSYQEIVRHLVRELLAVQNKEKV